MPAREPAYLDNIRALVSGDGLDLEYLRLDPMSGTLSLRLFAGESPCEVCVMSKDLLEDIALPIARKSDTMVRRVAIKDDRPESMRG